MVFRITIILGLFCSFLGAQEFIIPEGETYYASELQEYLQLLEEEPLSVNTCSAVNLSGLPWLDKTEIEKIIQFRQQNEITSWIDLKKISINEYDLQQLKPYITFKSSVTYHFRNQLRVELKEADLKKSSSLKMYQKTQISSRDFSFGFLTQKDPQEKNIFDFYSYYLEFFKDDLHTVVGKYRLRWGLGLAFASKLGFSKTAQTSYTKIYQQTYISPYTSSYEIWDLQGAAAEYRWNKFKITSFASFSQLSANLENEKITSFNSSGIHLNSAEKNNVNEHLFGLAIDYTLASFKIGGLAVYDKFDKEFYDENLNSRYSLVSGYAVNEQLGFPIFAEIAAADDKLAAVGGMRFGSSRFKNLLVARYYPKNFPTWHGKPFSEKSNFDNEQGIYYGLKFYPIPKLKINLYFDVWKHAKTSYWEKMPTSGNEQFVMLNYRYKGHSWQAALKNSFEEKYKNVAGISKIREVGSSSFSLKWRQNVNSYLTCDSYGKFVNEYLPQALIHERSFLFYQQVRFQKKSLDVIARLSTHYGDLPVYVYENNVDGIMQNRACSGEGLYAFVVCSWQAAKYLELQAKYFDYLEKKDKTELYFQLLTRF